MPLFSWPFCFSVVLLLLFLLHLQVVFLPFPVLFPFSGGVVSVGFPGVHCAIIYCLSSFFFSLSFPVFFCVLRSLFFAFCSFLLFLAYCILYFLPFVARCVFSICDYSVFYYSANFGRHAISVLRISRCVRRDLALLYSLLQKGQFTLCLDIPMLISLRGFTICILPGCLGSYLFF